MAEFKAARSIIPGAPGHRLEAVGKTRFGTVVYSARSLQRNLPVLKEIVKRGKFNMGTYAQYFDPKTNRTTVEFEFALAQIVCIGTPAIQALTCLESNTATAADVYVFFHAFVALTLETLEDKGMAFAVEEKNEIRSILEWRYNQLFGMGNLASDIYVSAAYLIPVHILSAFFKCQLAPNGHPDYAGIHNLAAFKRVVSFLTNIAEKEIKHGHKPELTMWRNRASLFVSKLLNELKAYTRQQYPFNAPYNEDLGPLLWWSALCNNELSQILPILAIKVLSVHINSMEEERTGSPHSPSFKCPKIYFYDFHSRFMDDTEAGEVQGSSGVGGTAEKDKYSDVIINGADADNMDDDDWLAHDHEVAKLHSASGSIDASPCALDSRHITAALAWNAPSNSSDISSTQSLTLEEIPSGDDNDFSLNLDF
ncbi:hypothetical protein AGABI2DRAFT_117929 [Agaricus bisporus var. bisporus H97]|uniref:hypothetical protein n=1 Tax=Agaricus bisporus var. bisporus (strain H97 / ATCC MYA-4626 / FGSC 10389) TaxID=936046 RepID=UPI00029F694B|nr:hypothetical protein AGABI2DRAFT_117929 [Agaricus bisporus var. bisporus H97]EKV47351.1 hypothetical protein AGABI2DRAFT_117929 [Agaricus bisporus var. bisporus H97]